LEQVKKYIDENDKRPSTHDNIQNIRIMGKWLSHQKENYKLKKQIMNNTNIYDKWTEFINTEKYKKYFISNEEGWINKLKDIKNYIDENEKRPSVQSKNKEIKQLGT